MRGAAVAVLAVTPTRVLSRFPDQDGLCYCVVCRKIGMKPPKTCVRQILRIGIRRKRSMSAIVDHNAFTARYQSSTGDPRRGSGPPTTHKREPQSTHARMRAPLSDRGRLRILRTISGMFGVLPRASCPVRCSCFPFSSPKRLCAQHGLVVLRHVDDSRSAIRCCRCRDSQILKIRPDLLWASFASL
jgi:hypothetical protein